MKKIIAAAVATAFVAPAFAADVTLSGAMEYSYNSQDGSAENLTTGDQAITIKATEELDNGVSVTATMNIMHDTDNTDTTVLTDEGSSLAITIPSFGTITVGDTAGALDSTGDWTDTSPAGAGFGADGSDHGFRWDLPTFVDGLKLAVSHSPDGTNDVSSEASEISNGADGYAATYSFGNYSVYYGVEEYTNVAVTDELSAYGAKASIGPIYVAVETGVVKSGTAATADINYDGLAVEYKAMDALTIGYDSRKDKADGSAASVDEQAIYAKYSVGGGLGLYVVSVNDDKASSPADSTHVGVTYAF